MDSRNSSLSSGGGGSTSSASRLRRRREHVQISIDGEDRAMERMTSEKRVDLSSPDRPPVRPARPSEKISVSSFYRVETTARVVKRGGYKRIALQFPDDMLNDAYAVVEELRRRTRDTGATYFILGDTSYGTRCVDEVAAKHADADFLVHYGDAFVGPTATIPTQFVFGDSPLRDEKVAEHVLSRGIRHAILFTENRFSWVAERVAERLRSGGVVAVVASPRVGDDGMWRGDKEEKGGEDDFVVVEEMVEMEKDEVAVVEKTEDDSDRAEKEEKVTICTRYDNADDVFRLIGGDTSDDSEEEEEAEEEEEEAEEEEEVTEPETEDTKDPAPPATTPTTTTTTRRLPLRYVSNGTSFRLPREHPRLETYDCIFVTDDTDTTTGTSTSSSSSQLDALRARFSGCRWWICTETNATRVDEDETRKILHRRYALVERIRDARVVGLVVGTLAVEGYLETLDRAKRLLEAAKKKTYVFVVGKINVPKLANFAEIDVFVVVAGPQTSLGLDRDRAERPIPVASVFELEIATGARKWTGAWWEEEEEEEVMVVDGDAAVEEETTAGKTRKEEEEDAAAAAAVALATVADRTLAKWSSPAADFLRQREWRGLEIRPKAGEEEGATLTQGRDGIASAYVGRDEA